MGEVAAAVGRRMRLAGEEARERGGGARNFGARASEALNLVGSDESSLENRIPPSKNSPRAVGGEKVGVFAGPDRRPVPEGRFRLLTGFLSARVAAAMMAVERSRAALRAVGGDLPVWGREGSWWCGNGYFLRRF